MYAIIVVIVILIIVIALVIVIIRLRVLRVIVILIILQVEFRNRPFVNKPLFEIEKQKSNVSIQNTHMSVSRYPYTHNIYTIYICIYLYVCVSICVCTCVWIWGHNDLYTKKRCIFFKPRILLVILMCILSK